MGEHISRLFEDLTSCGRALSATFGGFYVVWESAFCYFSRILRRVGEHFLRLLRDLTSCGGALSATFGGFYVGEGRGFLKPPDGHPHLST